MYTTLYRVTHKMISFSCDSGILSHETHTRTKKNAFVEIEQATNNQNENMDGIGWESKDLPAVWTLGKISLITEIATLVPKTHILDEVRKTNNGIRGEKTLVEVVE